MMAVPKAFVPLLLLLCGIPQRSPIGDLNLNVFYDTGHFPVPEDFRYEALKSIGRLYDPISKTTFCTATLVAPDVIATAAHCVVKIEVPGQPSSLNGHEVFVTGSISANSGNDSVELLPGTVRVMTNDVSHNSHRDIAFVRLATRLDPNIYPPAEIRSASFLSVEGDSLRKVTLTAYFLFAGPTYGVGTFATTEHCEITRLQQSKTFLHNCSTNHGSSGGPIYILEVGKLILIGIHRGGYHPMDDGIVPFSDTYANRAIDGEVIRTALVDYQAGKLKPDSY